MHAQLTLPRLRVRQRTSHRLDEVVQGLDKLRRNHRLSWWCFVRFVCVHQYRCAYASSQCDVPWTTANKSPLPTEKISKKLRRSQGGGVVFGEVVYGPGSSYGPRRQADYQLFAVLKGSAVVQVDTEEFIIQQGEVVLLRPGREEYFRFATDRLTHHSWCAVAPSVPSAHLAKTADDTIGALPMSARLAALFEIALGLPARDVPEDLVQALGIAALAEHVLSSRRDGPPRHSEEDVPPALQAALDWIGLRYAEPITAIGLAQQAGVSPAQMTKLFRRHLATTPMRAVWEARTRAGVQLLRDSGLNVGDIAWRCGFKTIFHFSRWVREIEGLSPREVRTRAWGASSES